MSIKVLFILALVPFFEQENVQNNPTGKNFKALVNETCKEMTDGGCMVYTYRILHFKTDSVTVSYQVIAYCSPKERENNYSNIYENFTKKYSWSVSKDTLTIYGLDDYGKLIFHNSKLYGSDKNTKRKIEFNEL